MLAKIGSGTIHLNSCHHTWWTTNPVLPQGTSMLVEFQHSTANCPVKIEQLEVIVITHNIFAISDFVSFN